MSRPAKGAHISAKLGWAIARHLAAVGAGIFTIRLVAQSLGPEGLGAWGLLGTSTFLMGLLDLGLPTAIQRAHARGDHDGAAQTLRLTSAVILALWPLTALGTWLYLTHVGGGSTPAAQDFGLAAAIAGVGGLAGALASPTRSWLIMSGALGPLAAGRALASVIQVSFTVAGLAVRNSMAAPAFALTLSLVAETIYLAHAAHKLDPRFSLRPRLPTRVGLWRAALSDGAAALTINAAVAAALRTDLLILGAWSPLSTLGAYLVASRGIDQIFTVAKQASSALLHRVADGAQRAQAVRMGTIFMTSVVGATVVSVAVFGKVVLVAWVGATAEDPATNVVLGLLGAAAVVAAMDEMASASLTLGGSSAWRAARWILLAHATNLVLSLLGAPRFGIWAVAGATLIGNVFLTVMVWREARQLLGWTTLEVLQTLSPGVAAALTTLTCGLLLRSFTPPSLGPTLVSAMLATLFGFAAAVAVTYRTHQRTPAWKGAAS